MKKVVLCLSVVLLVWTGSLWAQAANPPQQPAAGQEQAQSWTGTLADATCKQKNEQEKCPVASTTTTYGLVTSDMKFYKFDDTGNSLASAELQKASSKSGSVRAKVTGALEGDTIKVQSIQIR